VKTPGAAAGTARPVDAARSVLPRITARVIPLLALVGITSGAVAWMFGYHPAASAAWGATTVIALVPMLIRIGVDVRHGRIGVDVIALLAMAGALILGLCLALLLNRPFKGQKLVQTVLLLPLMVAPVIAAIMLRWMFNDQFGIVNVMLEAIGIEGRSWFTDRWSAFAVIVMTDIWLWTPWFTLLLLAGLQSLPREPFEAAAIDGATRWRVFRYLTLPMLRPVIVVCVVIRAIDAFRTFDIVWTLTGGGPARSTELFSLYAYEHAFLNLNFGRGSAAAIVGALIIVALGLVLYRILDRAVEVSR